MKPTISADEQFATKYLRLELASRQRINARYSLRAFARDLGLPASTVSEALSGKHQLSPQNQRQVMSKLGLISGQPPKMRRDGKTRGRTVFHPVGRPWPTLQALELMELLQQPGRMKSVKSWMRVWGLSSQDVQESLQNLIACGWIRDTERWEDAEVVSEHHRIGGGPPSFAVRQIHRELLGRASRALEIIDSRHRENLGLLLRFDEDSWPKLRLEVQRFKRRVRELAAQQTCSNRVIEIVIGAYPID